MKFKLIQLTSLFAFVMTIVMLAPSYDGFGDSANQHDPDFKIDSNGKRPPGASEDPRWRSFNEITCGTNGSQYVGAEAWYFKPGILEGGASSTHTPGDHLSNAEQLIFEVHLDGWASTSSKNAEASLMPSLSNLSAHPAPSSGMTSHQGEGRINLSIPELPYHIPRYYGADRLYYYCEKRTAQKHEFTMDNNVTIYVDVRVKTVKKRKTKKLEIIPTSTYGSVNFGYEDSSTDSHNELRTESFGIKAKVGNTYWSKYPGIELQEKTAKAYGTIHKQGSGTIDINAAYPRAPDTWCPGNPSVGQRAKVPHAHD